MSPGGAVHVGETRAVLLPDVAELAQGVGGVEPAGGLVDADGVEVRALRELLGQVAVAADDAAAVAHHAHDAAVLPVADLLLVGALENAPAVVVGHGILGSALLDLGDETRPRALLELVQ